MKDFLGTNEGLLQCLADDNQFVREQGLTHAELVYPLQLIASAYCAKQISPGAFWYQGKVFSLRVRQWKGTVESPFGDKNEGETDYIIYNLTDGAALVFSELGMQLIALYGFYEGKGSKYRIDPAQIIKVFGLKR